jgi:class 3 adenylate cyclase
VRESDVRFAERDGTYVAFTMFGTGPVDLIVAQSRFPIDLMWELPSLALFMESLGRFARVIVFDSHGGASDPLPALDASLWEHGLDQMLAVLDAAESEQASILDLFGTAGPAFAATYPDRVRSLIVVNLRASYPELQDLTNEQRRRLAVALRSSEHLRMEAPRLARDPELQRWWGRANRLVSSHEQLVRNMRWAALTDYSGVLPSVRVPTLVLHRRENRIWDIETSRATAELISGARFVELPGSENDLFLGDTSLVLDEIEHFLAQPDVHDTYDRVLATVLFTDIVASTEQLASKGDAAWRRVLEDHDQTMDRIVNEYRGHLVKQTGDGILATFDRPARAVRCAKALLDAAESQGITLRVGLHTGEIEVRPSDLAGIAVHIANRIATIAAPNEILVSRTVVDLTAGSGLQFEPRGEHQLKGVPGAWAIFAAG